MGNDTKEYTKDEATAIMARAYNAGMLIQDGTELDGVDWGHMNYILKFKPFGPISLIGRKDLKNAWPSLYRMVKRLLDVIKEQEISYKDLQEDVRVWRTQAVTTTTAARFYKGMLVESGLSHEHLENLLKGYEEHLDLLAAEEVAKAEEAANEVNNK